MAPQKQTNTQKPKVTLPEGYSFNTIDDFRNYVTEWELKVQSATNDKDKAFAERTLRYWQLALANAKVNEKT